jgi:hypothetical protein
MNWWMDAWYADDLSLLFTTWMEGWAEPVMMDVYDFFGNIID